VWRRMKPTQPNLTFLLRHLDCCTSQKASAAAPKVMDEPDTLSCLPLLVLLAEIGSTPLATSTLASAALARASARPTMLTEPMPISRVRWVTGETNLSIHDAFELLLICKCNPMPSKMRHCLPLFSIDSIFFVVSFGICSKPLLGPRREWRFLASLRSL
jgi:hypothetical protein